MTDELPPEEIAQLLKANERRQTLTPHQRSELWARVSSAPPFRDEAISVSPAIPEQGESRRRDASGREGRGRRSLLLAAAAAIVVVGAYVLAAPRQAQQVATITPADEAAEPAEADEAAEAGEAERCPAEAERLFAAIEVWESVENWSYLTDDRAPAPDLLQLANDALVGNLSESDVLPDVAALIADRDAGTFGFSSHDRRTLRSTIEAAVAELNQRHECP